MRQDGNRETGTGTGIETKDERRETKEEGCKKMGDGDENQSNYI
jgi:hypothetical protein